MHTILYHKNNFMYSVFKLMSVCNQNFHFCFSRISKQRKLLMKCLFLGTPSVSKCLILYIKVDHTESKMSKMKHMIHDFQKKLEYETSCYAGVAQKHLICPLYGR